MKSALSTTNPAFDLAAQSAQKQETDSSMSSSLLVQKASGGIIRALATLVLLSAPSLAGSITGPVRVIDGDTLEMAGQRIRLWGIDAPERGQTCAGDDGQVYKCGWDATAVLTELTHRRAVMCEQRARDRYSRVVAVCRTDAGDLGAAMVRRGWAVAYTRYSRGAYQAEEAAARHERLGIWAGRFDMPKEWRRKYRH